MDIEQEVNKLAPDSGKSQETPTPHELKNRVEMVQAYRLAAQVHVPAVWAEMMRQYPLLIEAYDFRKKILEQQASKPDDEQISVMSLDKYIIKKIADGELTELRQLEIKQEDELQP